METEYIRPRLNEFLNYSWSFSRTKSSILIIAAVALAAIGILTFYQVGALTAISSSWYFWEAGAVTCFVLGIVCSIKSLPKKNISVDGLPNQLLTKSCSSDISFDDFANPTGGSQTLTHQASPVISVENFSSDSTETFRFIWAEFEGLNLTPPPSSDEVCYVNLEKLLEWSEDSAVQKLLKEKFKFMSNHTSRSKSSKLEKSWPLKKITYSKPNDHKIDYLITSLFLKGIVVNLEKISKNSDLKKYISQELFQLFTDYPNESEFWIEKSRNLYEIVLSHSLNYPVEECEKNNFMASILRPTIKEFKNSTSLNNNSVKALVDFIDQRVQSGIIPIKTANGCYLFYSYFSDIDLDSLEINCIDAKPSKIGIISLLNSIKVIAPLIQWQTAKVTT